MSIKTKLILAFGGLIAILAIVGLVTFHTLNESSKAIDQIMRENYHSVEACYQMKDALVRLDHLAEISLWENPSDLPRQQEEARRVLEQYLKFQQGNVTLPGEQALTDRLTEQWQAYYREFRNFSQLSGAVASRRDFYQHSLLPRSQAFLDTAQKILELNLTNMVAADGRAHRKAVQTRNVMLLLLLSGIALALGFIVLVGPNIWRPIARLTQSVSEIQQGNLDLVVNVPSRDEVGQLAEAFNQMAASLREVRRSDRAQLLRTQQATLLALNSLPDAVAICNLDGRIELANDAAQRLFSLQPGANLAAAGYEKITEVFGQAAQGERPVVAKGYDQAIQVFTGAEERFFLPEAIPIFSEERQIVGVALILADITRLRRLDEVKSGLISTVSHELKGPLTSVRLALHVLLHEKLGPLSPKQVEVLEAARQDAERLYRVIEDLLDLSRIESGAAEMRLQPVTAESLVMAATEKVNLAFLDHGVALGLEVPADLPPVLADPPRIQVVLDNLLSNALKYTPRGGKVKVKAKRADGMVRFAVKDTGIGIAPEHLPHIFEKFFRVPGQEQVSSGLGLTIAQEIVAAHGGAMEAAGHLGKGTTISFTLKEAPAGGAASVS